MQTIKIYETDEHLEFYLRNIIPLDTDFDIFGNRYFIFEYSSWRKLYVKTLPSIDKIYYNKLEVMGDDKSR